MTPTPPTMPSLLQIERVKAFGEPAVDRSEKIAGLIPLALIAPEPRNAHCGAEFPGLCLLRARDRQLVFGRFSKCFSLFDQQARSVGSSLARA